MTRRNIEIIENNIQKFNDISNKYGKFEDIIDIEGLSNLANFSNNFKSDAESLIEENRKLRIGVVGQIKSGKSSFLNALLFNGKELLPKAATPMTAALTVISYKEKPSAVIEFYSEDEWKLIIDKSAKYDEIIDNERRKILSDKSISSRNITDEEIKQMINMPKEIESAKELANMAHTSGTDIYDYLGKEETIEEVDIIEDLIGKLNDYVGAKGSFTPIVKSSRLYINDNKIKNIEIVDTPGINDPILSRGQKTREYLGKCDVVFLLSYASQFMDSSDIGLLTQNVPNKGIENVVLLASKFDSALLDEGYKYSGFADAARGCASKLSNHANEVIIPILRRNPDNKILYNLNKSLPPKFISSMAYNIAVNYDTLNKEERFILNRLKGDFPNFDFSSDNLKSFSNIEDVKNKEFEKVINKKDEIIKDRFDNLLLGQKEEFKDILKDISQMMKSNLNKLTDSSEKELKNKQKYLRKGMERAKKKVDVVFDTNITLMKTNFYELITDLKSMSIKHKKINEQTSSKEKFVKTERYGFLWLKKRDIYKTVTYSYANIYQAIDHIDEFVLEAERSLQQEIKKIINMQKLSEKLKEAILDVFDLSDENFDYNEIISLVQKAVNKISIPDISIDSTGYSKKISSKFSGENVEGSDIGKLKSLQRSLIDEILNDIQNTVQKKTSDIVKHLDKVSAEFVDNILKESETRLDEITKQLKDKQTYIKRYNTVIEMIEKDLK